MFGSIDEWFYRSVLGINAGAPGFEKLILKPQPVNSLTWAKGRYRSIKGDIVSEWNTTGADFSFHVIIPPNTKAIIYIPSRENGPVTENGQTIAIGKYENGYAVFETGSGEYAFNSVLK